jgi:hypothetical protein
MIAACKTILGVDPGDDNEADALWILEMARQGYFPPKQAARQMAQAYRKREQRLF